MILKLFLMKLNTGMFIAAITAALLFASCAPAPYAVVREVPPPPYAVQPVAPYPGAVWVSGEYFWRGGRYVYAAPHYVRPRYGRVWVPGYWNSSRGGYVWRRGHWR